MLEGGDLAFAYILLIVLIAVFVVINVGRLLRGDDSHKRATNPLFQATPVSTFAGKTILFLVFYGFGVTGFDSSLNGTLDAMIKAYCNETNMWHENGCSKDSVLLHMLAEGAINFSPQVIISNIFMGLYIFAGYFYFNVQMGFTTLVWLFSSKYLGTHDYNFIILFLVISIAVAIGVVFYKFKRRLLNLIRYVFFRYGNSKPGRLIEFYVICLPYFAFSTSLSILALSYSFNTIIQVVFVHAIAYFTIYRLYRDGRDIGFDYDPW